MGIALAKAIKKLNKNNIIIGYDINKNIIQSVMKQKLIDENYSILSKLAEKSDLIILATPVSTFTSIIKEIKEYIQQQIIVDIGSVKNKVYQDISNILSNNNNCYVPSHPITGGKSLDINNIDDEIKRVPNNLFQNKITHLFPNNSNRENFEFVKNFYTEIGAIINIDLTLQQHDKIYALTSHLPMFISAIFLSLLDSNNKDDMVYRYFLDKFLDKMWLSVFIDNIENIEYWCQEINYKLQKTVSANDISNIFDSLVKTNNFVDFTGNGYNVFISYNNQNYIDKSNFIQKQREILQLCKNKNVIGLQNCLLTIYNRFKNV